MSSLPAVNKDVGNYPTSQACPAPAAADALGSPPRSAAETSRGRPSPFAEILKRAKGEKKTGARRPSPAEKKADGGEGQDDSTSLDSRNLSQWFRPEIPGDAIRPVRPPLRIAPHQRVLVSQAGTAPQARIEISAGRMAGSQIQITANGRGIDAQLLTGNEASRQTLVAAMDAVRERLRVRGVLLASAVERRAPAQDAPDQRQSAQSGVSQPSAARHGAREGAGSRE